MTSEDTNPSGVDGSKQSEDMDEDSGSCSSSGFRVKAVEEINSTVSASTNEENAKRKLPTWMQSNTENVGAKRIKNGPQQNDSAQESAVASTSSSDVASESVQDDCCDQNNEIDNCNEAVPTNATEDGKTDMKIKAEPVEASSSSTVETTGGVDTEEGETDVKAKTEDDESSEPGSSSGVDNKADMKVVKVEATSSTRDSCKFGIRCYRRNPQHRVEEAHPGDSDYRRPDFPDPPKGTPPCPYGDRCYRRNPIHFQSYSHPPSTDFKKNWQQRQKRQRKQKKDADFEYDDDFIDDNDEDLDDPFGDDASDDEYVPSDDD